MRTTAFVLLASGVLLGCSVAPTSVTEQPLSSAPDDPVDPEPEVDPSARASTLIDAYVDEICALHARPDCVRSRTLTCEDGLDLSDRDRCRSLLGGTAKACPGIEARVVASAAQIEACVAHLNGVTCDETPACGEAGPVESLGPCAPVAEMMTTACADLPELE